MKFRVIVGWLILAVVLLFLVSTYVSFSDYVEGLSTRGAWDVEFNGRVFLSGGSVYAVIDELKVVYDSSPEIPSYGSYLSDRFSLDGDSKPLEVADNQTFVKVRYQLFVDGTGIDERELVDETVKIPYAWAGGDIGMDGQIGSFTFELGPYIAYHEYSPYKITGRVSIDGHESAEEVVYLTIEDLSEVTDG